MDIFNWLVITNEIHNMSKYRFSNKRLRKIRKLKVQFWKIRKQINQTYEKLINKDRNDQGNNCKRKYLVTQNTVGHIKTENKNSTISISFFPNKTLNHLFKYKIMKLRKF